MLGTRPNQFALYELLDPGLYELATPAQGDITRACQLMRKYADAPMDFADASLVVAGIAEHSPHTNARQPLLCLSDWRPDTV